MVESSLLAARAVDHEGLRLRAWHAPGLLTDFRVQAERPMLAVRCCHVLGGFEIPFVPLPFHEQRVPLSRAYAEHRDRFLEEMQRMLYGLHDPVMWRGSPRERLMPVTTYDLRIVNCPQTHGGGGLRMFLLVKAFVPLERSGDEDAAQEAACRRVENVCRLCHAQAPPSLALDPFQGTESAAAGVAHRCAVGDDILGLDMDFAAFGEIRRENFLTTLRTETDYQKFCESLASGQFFAVPEPWPESTHDLVPTCGFMSAAVERLVVSIRLQPTVRTQNEHTALLDTLERLAEQKPTKKSRRVRTAVRLLARYWRSRELYLTALQVAGQSPSMVGDLMTTLASEFAATRADERPQRSPFAHQHPPARLSALDEREQQIARYNLQNLEFLPWGGVSEKAVAAAHPAGSSPRGLPTLHSFTPTDELRLPDTFLRRDLTTEPQLVRFRRLFSVREAAGIWRLPIANRAGHGGVVCQLPSPFPYASVPASRPVRGISLGQIEHRGVKTGRHFRLPLFERSSESPSLSQSTVVVAGGPGTGKTSLARFLLTQLWDETEPAQRIPFLALDLAGRGEYRQLADALGSNLHVLPLEDGPAPSLLFNPLVPARDVSVASHMEWFATVIASSFGLPADLSVLLGEALRRAYQRRGHPAADHPGDASQPNISFPTFSDVCLAMGEGGPTENATVLGELAPPSHRSVLASEWRRFRELLPPILLDPSPPQCPRALGELLTVPTVLEFPAWANLPVKRLAFSCLVMSLVEALQAKQSGHPHVLVIDDVHVLQPGSAELTEPSGAPWSLTFAGLLQRLTSRQLGAQLVILLDQAPVWISKSDLTRPLFCIQSRPSDATSFELVADMLHLNSDQRQYARDVLSPGSMVVTDPTTGAPIIICRPHCPPQEVGREKT